MAFEDARRCYTCRQQRRHDSRSEYCKFALNPSPLSRKLLQLGKPRFHLRPVRQRGMFS